MDLVIRNAHVVDGTGAPAAVPMWPSSTAGSPRSVPRAPPALAPPPAGRSTPTGSSSPRLHRHARAQRSRAAPRPRPQRQGRAGRHARSPRPGRAVVRPGRRPDARRGPPFHHRLERKRRRHRLRLAHGRRVPGPAGPQLRRPGHRGQRRLSDPAGHGPDVRGRLGGPPGHRGRAGPDEGAFVAQGMAEGAVGMSSGLTYTPGMYADDAELTELCRVVAEYDGYYCPHHRSYGAGRSARTRRWCSSPGTRAAPSISPTPP